MKLFQTAKRKVWAIVLIIIPLLFFYQILLYQKLPFPGDLLIAEYNPWKTYSYLGYNPGSYPNKAQYFDVLRQLYPEKMFSISQIKNSQVPLWNPYNFSGVPLLANFQSAVFYPLGLLYLIFDIPIAWSILVIAQPLMSFYFTYLYMRKLKVSKEASLLAAVSYAFSHFMIVWLEYNTIGHVISFLPLVLLSIENLLERKTAFWSFVFVFALVSSILAGHIQIAGYIFIFVFIYIVIRARKKLFSLLTLFVLSVGISGIQLLPGIELIINSARSNHEYSFMLQKILIQPNQLAMLLVPDFFGNPATRNYFLQDTYIGKVTSIGLISLFFASLNFFIKKNIFIKFYLTTSAIVLILVTLNPITRFLYSFDIPIISASSPTLSTFVIAFSLSILAGFGLDAFKNKTFSNRVILFSLAGFTSLFSILWFIVFLAPQILNIQSEINSLITKKNLLYETILLGFIFISMLIMVRFKDKRVFILFVLIFLQTADLWRSFNKFNPFVPKELFFPSTEITTFLKNNAGIDRFWGYKAAEIEANFATYYSLFSPDGYNPLYPKSYGEFINLSKSGKLLDNFNTTNRSDAIISREGSLKENNSRLKTLDLLGTSYILDRVENGSTIDDFPSERFENVYEDNGWKVFKNLRTAPRIFLTASYEVYSSKKDFESKFGSPNFDPSTTILLEKDPGIKLGEDKQAIVGVKQYSPNKVILQTKASEDQLLFLSDTFFPGWKGDIDGKPSEIIRANYAFRAMVIPKGKHAVVMEYKPDSFRMGLIITLSSLIALLSYLYLIKQKRYNEFNG